MKKQLRVILISIAVFSACGDSNSQNNNPVEAKPTSGIPAMHIEKIKLNQVGFLPSDTKIAVVPSSQATTFLLVNANDGSQVFTGQLSASQHWAPAKDEVSIADFSSVTAPGEYRIKVSGFADSNIVTINNDAFLAAHDAALKAYYFNRASSELLSKHAGIWSRPSGHADDNVLIHTSAASAQRPEGTAISAPKGWYDAGDYNKYIVNSGISVYTLLVAYEHHPEFYQNRDIGIPESTDSSPDILDEIKWNLDWMMAMQDPNDGGVYHKLTTLNFSGAVMPSQGTAQRYVVQKGTAASLNFAASLAVASRIYQAFPQFADVASEYRHAAELAWQWAQDNPNVAYVQPKDVSTGGYGDQVFLDEFSWAAAELFLLTADAQYLQQFKQLNVMPSIPGWSNSAALGYISLLNNGKTILSNDDYRQFLERYLALADNIVNLHQQSAYAVAMQNSDFVWGSNAVALNKAFVLLQAQRFTQNEKYKTAATGLLDYVLGRNPTDYSYLTGFGEKTPVDIHHRPSHADNVVAPVPGFVAGGAQSGQQDGCSYPSKLPASSYVDDWCSYSTNEVTINWNAPLVYVLAGLHTTQ
ncbi:glycoside hydrolase family 9 protein [uncultured Paraglaciecola sp.]|uniref:glycoside hydrolase family 9 protein n=1 Tax=uncultured Paraglaciecola sp. TaxID=1765024 RepID=UPI002600987A|nr:glycoside hydrolase family 9 protein [uncultured Paraglaciecola sp.]